MLIVSHNLTSMNTQRQLGINAKNRAKATEKLSSGFDINRAADNAAGLAISEKMRRLIRGLEQGTRNAEDGISWTQIGDGAINEAHDILQRMNQLSGANALSGYKDKVEAVADGNKILIRAKDGSGVDKVEVSAANNNTGFDEIFQGYNITYKPVKVEGTGSVTTTTPFEGVIRPQDNPFVVIVGNQRMEKQKILL